MDNKCLTCNGTGEICETLAGADPTNESGYETYCNRCYVCGGSGDAPYRCPNCGAELPGELALSPNLVCMFGRHGIDIAAYKES